MLSIVILFAQLTIAAYACPATGGDASEAVDMAGVPCAEMMAADVALDPGQPILCMQHCQFGSTTHVVDHVPAVFVPEKEPPKVERVGSLSTVVHWNSRRLEKPIEAGEAV